MHIKDIETRTGLSRANIRYYEQEGLVHPVRARNGYRDYSQEDLDAVADELNGRPRMTLGWSKPIEVYAEHLARLSQQPDSVH